MSKRMLIDATHPEETRVVVTDGQRLSEYDVETAAKTQLKGNIYLARVVRVEPSLQAAFIEYGGNRHGFLAFGEIHPDYYQIPVADRQRLLEMQEQEARAQDRAEDAALSGGEAEAVSPDQPDIVGSGEDAASSDEQPPVAEAADDAGQPAGEPADDAGQPEDRPETIGGEHDTSDDQAAERRFASRLLRQYKIQEVIRRRQILLVQVVKEERGTKGAALTTYVSLAGRYSVLMPNSPRGGGVSRKITSASDRKRLKEVTAELDLPRGMGMIVRTAGANRPKPEIVRDGETLLNLWDDIRETTLKSVAPALIHEEASLIKRALRDSYAGDVEEVLVDGEAGWRVARDYMRLMMPSHVQKVRLWREGGQSLFNRHQVEQQLDSMLQPTVQLRSGGYLVINQTEALVAIDVNSGRSTRERGIEETALRTNLEAAEEVARQLRLRDLAGLIVIDFIDMESRRHNGMVERKLKESLGQDRARIQLGGISHFGLLEMSRQRLRPSLAETSFVSCTHCGGTGLVRGTESAALHVLRALEEEGGRRRAGEILVHVASAVILYILNHKRARLGEIEIRCGMRVAFQPDNTLPLPQHRIDRLAPHQGVAAPIPAAAPEPEEAEEETAPVDEAVTAETAPASGEGSDESGRPRRRRRRRGGRGRRREGDQGEASAEEGSDAGDDEDDEETDASETHTGPIVEEAPEAVEAVTAETAAEAPPAASEPKEEESPEVVETEAEAPPARRRAPRTRRAAPRRKAAPDEVSPDAISEGEPVEAPTQSAPEPAAAIPAEASTPTPPPRSAPQAPVYRGPTPANPFADPGFDVFDALERSMEAGAAPTPVAADAEAPSPTEPAPKRRGWWRRG